MEEPRTDAAGGRRRPPLTLRPGKPRDIPVRLEAGGLVVETRGQARVLLLMTILFTLIFVGACLAFGLSARAGGPDPVTIWLVFGTLGAASLAASVALVRRIRRGDDHKVLFVDTRGVHSYTAREGSPMRTIPLDQAEVAVAEGGLSESEHARSFNQKHVRVRGAGETFDLACDWGAGTEWLRDQISAAIDHLRGS